MPENTRGIHFGSLIELSAVEENLNIEENLAKENNCSDLSQRAQKLWRKVIFPRTVRYLRGSSFFSHDSDPKKFSS